MGIIFTNHAKEMLKFRKIDLTQATECIRKPDKIMTGSLDKKIYLKDFGVNFLKVIASKEGKNIVIITLYWIAKRRIKL